MKIVLQNCIGSLFSLLSVQLPHPRFNLHNPLSPLDIYDGSVNCPLYDQVGPMFSLFSITWLFGNFVSLDYTTFFADTEYSKSHYNTTQATVYPSTHYSIATLPLNTIPLTYGNQEHMILLSYDSYYIALYRFRDNQISIIFVVQNNILYIFILPTSLIKIP